MADSEYPTTLKRRFEDEKIITGTLYQVTNWRFPITSHDVARLVAKYVKIQGRIIKEWKNNYLGADFVANYLGN